MTVKNQIECCIECEGSVGFCFCSCPYCGNMTKNCHCNLENPRDDDKVLSTRNYSKPSFLKQPNQISVVSDKDDGWWRLEKWQIGRSKFS